MKISIVVPVYNTSKYLNKCINSILNQTFKNFEVILVNDGSTDNSLEICNEYMKIDKRVIVIDKLNTGSSNSRNIGINKAIGKYICFIDSDDWVESNMLEEKIKLITKNNVDLVISGINIDSIDLDNNIKTVINNYSYNEWNTEELLRKNIIKLFPQALINSSCNKLYNLELIKSNDIKFPHTNIGEDTLFNLSVIKLAKGVIVTDKSYYHYMRYTNIITLTRRVIPNAYKCYTKIHEEMLEMFREWDKLNFDVEKIINKTMFAQYYATTLKILKANKTEYPYKVKKYMLNEGLKQRIILNTFNATKAYSYKESLLRNLIKNRIYSIAIIFIKLLEYKEKYKKGGK